MAKNQFPGVKTGSGLLAKVIGFAVTLLVLWFVIRQFSPSAADGMAAGLGAALSNLASGLGSLLMQLGK